MAVVAVTLITNQSSVQRVTPSPVARQSSAPPPPLAPVTFGPGDWRVAANWQLAQPGMTQEQVERILGPPSRVFMGDLIYEGVAGPTGEVRGNVSFGSGRVTSTVPPRFTPLPPTAVESDDAEFTASPSRSAPALSAPTTLGPGDFRVAANWSLIQTGMSEGQVTAMLGQPTRNEFGNFIYEGVAGRAGEVRGEVRFGGGRVTRTIPPRFTPSCDGVAGDHGLCNTGYMRCNGECVPTAAITPPRFTPTRDGVTGDDGVCNTGYVRRDGECVPSTR